MNNLKQYEQNLKATNPDAYGNHCLKMIGINLLVLGVIGGLMALLIHFH